MKNMGYYNKVYLNIYYNSPFSWEFLPVNEERDCIFQARKL